MSSSWYIHKDGQQLGPYSREQLSSMAQSGEINPQTQVWADGMSNWIPASQLTWLFGSAQAPPQPGPGYPPPGPAYTPPGSYGQAPKKGGPLKIILIVLALLLVLGGGGVFAALTFAQNALLDSEVYSLAMSALKESPESIEYLGQPIESSGRITGSVTTSNGSGDGNLNIPVSGSKASGTLYAEGKKEGGIWNLTRLELQGNGKRIDILAESARLAEATITIENNLGFFDIYFIYYTLEGGDWSDDLLGDSVLVPGGTFTFTVEPGQRYDFQVIDEDLDIYTRYDVLIDGDYTWAVDLDDMDFGLSTDITLPTGDFAFFQEPGFGFTVNYPPNWDYELHENEAWFSGPLAEGSAVEGNVYFWQADGTYSSLDEAFADVEDWFIDSDGAIIDFEVSHEIIGGIFYPMFFASGIWYDLDDEEYFEAVLIIEKEEGEHYIIGFFFPSSAAEIYDAEIDAIFDIFLDTILFVD